MNTFIHATRCPFAIFHSGMEIRRLWRVGLVATAIAVTLQPTVGRAQGPDSERAMIDAASDLGASRYVHRGQPLGPSEIGHVLRDWGLRLLSGPTRSATSYQAIVRDDAGQDLFVSVDPYDGRILNLDLTDRALAAVSFFRGDAGEGLDRENVVPLPGVGKPRSSWQPARRNTRAATSIVSPQTSRKPRSPETASPRLTAVEPSAVPRAPKRAVATAHPSAGVSRPGGETTAGPASTPAPSKAEPARHASRMISPAEGRSGDVSAPLPPAPPPLAEAQKIEKQPAKPVIPADAGFD